MKQKFITVGVVVCMIVLVIGMYMFTQKSPSVVSQQIASQNHTAHQVMIKNFAFSPQTIKISAGTAITWTNHDTVQHTATSNAKIFDTGVISPNQSKTILFQNPGTYPYHCMIHPHMMGTVVVQ